MRHWNYRMVRVKHPEETLYYIREVHYDDGKIIAISQEPAIVMSEEPSSIKWILDKMKEALTKPVIDHETFEPLAPDAVSLYDGEDGTSGQDHTVK